MSHPNDAPQLFPNAPGIPTNDLYNNSIQENSAMEILSSGNINTANPQILQQTYPSSFLEGMGETFNSNIAPGSPLRMQNSFSLDFSKVPLMEPSAPEKSLESSHKDVTECSSPEKASSQNASNRPKRPMNAFLLFSTQRRRELRSQDENFTTSELSKLLGKEWSELDEEHKREFQEKANIIKKDFFEKHPDYAYTRKPKQPRMQTQTNKLPIAPPAFLFRDKSDIKRPMNAYLLFNRESRPKLLQENSKLTTSELSQKIGERWRSMSGEERQTYVERAAQMRQEFFDAHPGHIFTRQTKQEKRALLAYKAIAPSARGRKKRARNSDAPKHPMSAFLFYLVRNRGPVAEQNSGCPAGPIAKILSHRWKELSADEKAPWLELAQQDKERYARELKAYQEEQAAAKERRKELGIEVVPTPMHRPTKVAKPVKPAAKLKSKPAVSNPVPVTDSILDVRASSDAFMGQHLTQNDDSYVAQCSLKPEAHYTPQNGNQYVTFSQPTAQYVHQSDTQYTSQSDAQYIQQPTTQYTPQNENQYSLHYDNLYGSQRGNQHAAPFETQNVLHHDSQFSTHGTSFDILHVGSAASVRNYDMSSSNPQAEPYSLDHQTRSFSLGRPESSDALHQTSMGHPPSEHDISMLPHLGTIGMASEEPSHSVAYMHHSDSGLQQSFSLAYSEPTALPHSDTNMHITTFPMHHTFNIPHSSFAMHQTPTSHTYPPINQQPPQFDHLQAPHSDLDS